MKKNNEKTSIPSFWIAPDIDSLNTQPAKKTKKKSHYRSCSGGESPYQDKSYIAKLKSKIKSSTRKPSPNSSYSKRTSPPARNFYKTSAKNFSILISKKKKTTNKKRRKSCKKHYESLSVLDKNSCQVAPKIFDNQIFRDFYDGAGKHDRIMETFEISENSKYWFLLRWPTSIFLR